MDRMPNRQDLGPGGDAGNDSLLLGHTRSHERNARTLAQKAPPPLVDVDVFMSLAKSTSPNATNERRGGKSPWHPI